MPYTLVITEKPNASKRIAEALADGKPIKKDIQKVPYYLVTHGKQDLVVACAVGHLYGLKEKDKKKGLKYPVFDIEWAPTSDIDKKAAFSKKYLSVLKKLAKKANSFIVATDYDIEGEVIGLNCVRFACKQKDAKRMKFSTLTKSDLLDSFDNLHPTLDWGQAEAGETRHMLDWYYGINLSRALTHAIKSAGMFKILSVGRVQGPALKIVVEREKEIKAFKPVPFWQISILTTNKIEAWHKEDKFWEKGKAISVHEKVRAEKQAVVSKIDKAQTTKAPPFPFDLTTLQTESYRCFGFSPKQTLALAQELYLAGLISYPRTSSQQLDPKLGFKKILNKLSSQKNYIKLCNTLLNSSLKPNNGKKSDPAHPAIYPTGEVPKSLSPQHAKVYDIVVRRFLATFGEPAKRETLTITLDVAKEYFIAKGTRTTEPGWHVYYGPYVKLKEEELPKVRKDDVLTIKKAELHAKETQPPKRYTESSLVRELEKRNIGTKATRAQIIDTIQHRHYITGKPIEATELGIHTYGVLQKFVPEITDEGLTRHFEEEMEGIREKKKKKETVLVEAQEVLNKILNSFKKKEKEVGEALLSTFQETRKTMSTIGACPSCKEGSLVIKRGKFGAFVACDKYPDCTLTLSLPKGVMVQSTGKVCDVCKFPIIKSIQKGKRPQETCINPNCPKKEVAKVEEKPCEKCGKGTMILKRSIYGQFLACNKYPKCRNTESVG